MPVTPTNQYTNEVLQPLIAVDNTATVAFVPGPSLYFQAGALLQELGSAPTKLIPVPSGVAGTPVAINKRTFTTDANGAVTYGTPANGGEFGQTYTTAEAYFRGGFKVQDLVQTGAGAMNLNYGKGATAQRFGNLIGSATAGIFSF
jgi:hypothetical protein